MLPLDSPRWKELTHAYGSAADVPTLLRGLASFPSSDGESEPWFSIWSSLAHQGDVFAASYAAVPHVIATLASAPQRADISFFHFPAWVEICRTRRGPQIPVDLASSYFAALTSLPRLVAQVEMPCPPERLPCCLAAVAVANGQARVAEAALELTPETAEEFMEWFHQR